MELNKTFIDGLWSKEINVTSFVQKNTPLTKKQFFSTFSFLAQGNRINFFHGRPLDFYYLLSHRIYTLSVK